METHSAPMFPVFELTPDLLATHGRALRALARSLLRDDAAAEDVVQETWLACLRAPGAVPERVSAWLGTVASRLALRRKRGESRRRVRESQAAVPERLDPLQQRALEREEALRAVTQALLALDEPLKTTLLLRYYEDRSPTEIAAELGVPLATVKSRLARGLERLRAKLGAELGDDARARALLVLAGASAADLAPAAAVAAGTTVAWLGGAALLAVAAGVGANAWQERARAGSDAGGGTPPANMAQLGGVASVPSAQDRSVPATPTADAAADESHREPLAAAAAAAPERAALPPAGTTFPFRITGIVRDEHDLPRAGARVLLAPRGIALHEVAVTDERGAFAVEFDGRRAGMTCVFTVADGARWLGLRELALASGRPLAIDVALTDEVTAPARVRAAIADQQMKLDAERAAARVERVEGLPARVAATETRLTLSGMVAFAGTGRRLAGAFDRAPTAARDAAGRVVFLEPSTFECGRSKVLVERARRDFEASVGVGRKLLTERDDEVRRRREVLELDSRAAQGLVSKVEAPPAATLRGVVRDASGAPESGVPVGWGPPGGGFSQLTHTGDDGAFELSGIPPGEYELHAGGGDHGRASERVTLAGGTEHAWNAVLDRGEEVTGRVALEGDVLEGDVALAGMRVELWSVTPTSLWCDATVTDAEGRFALPNAPSGALELLVYATGPNTRPGVFPARRIQTVFAGTDVGAIVLAPRDLVTVGLTAALVDADGAALPGAQLLVWHEESGRGLIANASDAEGKLGLAGLPRGSYRLEASTAFGWRDLGRVWVEQDLALDPERFASPGALAWSVADPVAAAVALWRAHADVFARVASGAELAQPLVALRPGEYVFCAERTSGAATERAEQRFAVQSGAVSGLAVESDARGALALAPRAAERVVAPVEMDLAASCSSCHAPAGR